MLSCPSRINGRKFEAAHLQGTNMSQVCQTSGFGRRGPRKAAIQSPRPRCTRINMIRNGSYIGTQSNHPMVAAQLQPTLCSPVTHETEPVCPLMHIRLPYRSALWRHYARPLDKRFVP